MDAVLMRSIERVRHQRRVTTEARAIVKRMHTADPQRPSRQLTTGLHDTREELEAAVERDFTHTSQSLRAIAEKHGISVTTLNKIMNERKSK